MDAPVASDDAPVTFRERVANRYARLWSLPTTSAGLHLLGCVSVAGLRVICLVQLLVALPSSVAVASRPVLDLTLAAVFLLESAWLLRQLARHESASLGRAAVLDVLVVCCLLMGQLLYVSPGGFVSTWQAWGFGVSMSTVLLISLAAPNFRIATAGAVALAASYVLAVVWDAQDLSEFMTVGTNAFGFLANVFVARFVWTYLVRLAHDADAARKIIAKRRRDDRMKLRAVLHDQHNILIDIAKWEDLASDEDMQESTRRRARVAATTLRATLNDQREDSTDRTLGAALSGACAKFPHLNVTVMTDLVDDLVLTPPVLKEVDSIVTTLLTNVHKHADSDAVTVHGDVLDGRRWEVSVHDDGVGFDPSVSANGYGWSEHVPGACKRIGARAQVRSSPGTGTTVTIIGPVRSDDGPRRPDKGPVERRRP